MTYYTSYRSFANIHLYLCFRTTLFVVTSDSTYDSRNNPYWTHISKFFKVNWSLSKFLYFDEPHIEQVASGLLVVTTG